MGVISDLFGTFVSVSDTVSFASEELSSRMESNLTSLMKQRFVSTFRTDFSFMSVFVSTFMHTLLDDVTI